MKYTGVRPSLHISRVVIAKCRSQMQSTTVDRPRHEVMADCIRRCRKIDYDQCSRSTRVDGPATLAVEYLVEAAAAAGLHIRQLVPQQLAGSATFKDPQQAWNRSV